MKFISCKLNGPLIIQPEKIEDERGFFARVWDEKIFRELGLNSKLAQCNISFNKIKGTVRGLHFQKFPFEEDKLVRCTKGSIFDAIVDMRKDSPTFMKWMSFELSDRNYKTLYIPKGFAHGFQTLEDNTEVFYQMSEFFNMEYSSGVCWNDPKIDIKWPLPISIISKKDTTFELL